MWHQLVYSIRPSIQGWRSIAGRRLFMRLASAGLRSSKTWVSFTFYAAAHCGFLFVCFFPGQLLQLKPLQPKRTSFIKINEKTCVFAGSADLVWMVTDQMRNSFRISFLIVALVFFPLISQFTFFSIECHKLILKKEHTQNFLHNQNFLITATSEMIQSDVRHKVKQIWDLQERNLTTPRTN